MLPSFKHPSVAAMATQQLVEAVKEVGIEDDVAVLGDADGGVSEEVVPPRHR